MKRLRHAVQYTCLRETMQRYKPHTFDTRGFFFGVKCLLAVTVVLVGVRYGTAFASDILAGDVKDTVAAAATSHFTSEPTPSSTEPGIKLVTPAPRVSATAFVIGDLDTGDTIASKDADTPHPIASISKLLVALAVRETLSPESKVTITRDDRAQTEGTPGSIQRDETFFVRDLFYPLLMESNNSVAYALERAGGGDEFVRVMLRIAHEAGMDETLLNDSSGLSAKNLASARDLLALAHHIGINDPELFDITRTKSKSVTAISRRTYPVANLNIFTSDPTFLGGKTGYTDEAKQTMLAVFELPIKNKEKPVRVAIIVLGSSDRKGDIQKLRTWFEKNAVFE